MNQIAKQIIFWNLQRKKQRNKNNKKANKALYDNLIRFKTIEKIEAFDEIYDVIHNNRYTDIYISCNLFPRDIMHIGKYTEVGFSSDVIKELRWHLKTIGEYKQIINDFLYRREIIDELIYCGEYQEAENRIIECEAEYGLSLWLLEEKICVYNNLEKNINEIMQGCEKNVITSILDFYIMRLSKEVTFTDYSYFVQREISKFLRIYPDSCDLVSIYHYMIAPYSFEMNDNNILHLLRFIYNMPLFDRYLCIVDLCEFIMSNSKNNEYKDCIRHHFHYLFGIEDSTLDVLKVMLEEFDENTYKKVFEDPLLEIKNDFISGKMEECLEKLVQHIQNSKFNIQAYNMLVEVVQLMNKNILELEIDQIKKEVIYQLSSVYSIDERFNDSIEVIRKKIISCVHSWWARDLYNSVTRRNQPIGNEIQNCAIIYSNFQNLTIETVCENLIIEEALLFLDKIRDKNSYFEFWYAYLSNDLEKIENNCKVVEIVDLLNARKKTEFKCFNSFLHSNDVGSIMRNRFAQLMWKNVSKNHEIEAAIDYFLELFVIREEYATIAPINKFVEYVKYSKDVDKRDLRVPILHYINSMYFDGSKRDDLTIACENYFDLNCVEKPSRISIYEETRKEKIIYFLKNICVPQIMGPVLLSIRTDRELDQERIDTCQLLRQIDPENEKMYEDEIMELTRKLFINEGLMTIESNKIHVNTDGLKSKLVKNLKSEFNNFLYYRNHQIDKVLQTIKNIEGGEKLQIITLDESQMFNEIVYKIRNEFVLGGEYSLDGYLSINIRHGILDGQLRAPLAKYNLLTTYRVEKDDYDVKERWLYAIKDFSLRKKVTEAIIEFNKEIEHIIYRWKNSLIQVSTEEKPTQGVFDYSLNEADIRILQTYLTENITLEEFIDILFNHFWKITEKNLSKMKKIISEEISVQINDAFEKLIKVFRGVVEKHPFPDAMRWLGSVKNEMDEEVEKVANWFCRSAESQQADFDIDYALQIGFKMIQNIHPERKFVLNVKHKQCDQKISGKYLKFYWDIFYTQFDNISKYASVVDEVISIDYELCADNTSVYIKLENDYDCSNGIEAEEEKISSAKRIISDKAYLAKAKQEGGSGIPKIYKIMSSDLDMTTNINCEFDKERNKFYIEIKGEY